MQRKRGELVRIGEFFSGLDGPCLRSSSGIFCGIA